MKIKRSPLQFHNVISTTVRCKTDEWYMAAREFRNAIIRNELYSTGPIIYQVSEFDEASNEANYSFYIPVNEPVEMAENDKYRFDGLWKFEDGLSLRHADLEDDIEESYELLRAAADTFDLELKEPYYNIYLDVYGDGIIDIYAPIAREGQDGQSE
ncbi:DUF5085 family protein [Camelliibacillus cellulosilyticus]|uniref:DUF5085 family protein n=1 Tax=Camelliibacillus cellulosilyticus TaxID=2174486 RepID=A0ABV9GP99_9BACL